MNIPAWLLNLWVAYKDIITPVLITLMTAIITAIALKIKTDAKVNSAKADLQIEAMKKIADKEDYSSEIENQTKEIKALENSVEILVQMVDLAFENSALDSDVKSSLTSLKNKIVYGTNDERVKALEEELETVKVELLNASKNEEIKLVETEEPVTTKRIRR